MAGTHPRFNADKFRDGIHLAMGMGTPNDPAMRATFHLPDPGVHADADADEQGEPWDFSDPLPSTPAAPATVQVPVAIASATGTVLAGTSLGAFNPDQHLLVLLDEDWDEVSDFDWVSIGGDRYDRVKVESRGLFDVDVWFVKVSAGDVT